jgi:hypothetical protein
VPNTSATGGYLEPKDGSGDVQSVWDDPLVDDLQAIVVGITGLSGDRVRPRWQEDTPAQPARSVDWCAVGVVEFGHQGRPTYVHRPAGDGEHEMRQTEVLTVMASFYGPHSSSLGARLRDGLYLGQNHEFLFKVNMGLVEVRPMTNAPELVNGKFIPRNDVTFVVNRLAVRRYPVLNVLEAQGVLRTDEHSVPYIVKESN